MRARKKRNIVIGALCGVLLLMTVGYAAFSDILNIKGTTNINSNWDISITNVESKNIVGGASNAEDPTWDKLTATFKTNLVSPGDSIEYDVTVENKGTLNAKLDKITLSDTKNPAIIFTSSGITEGEVLNAGSTAVLTVKVEYDQSVTSQPKDKTSSLGVTLDYSQSDKKGMPSGPSASDALLENVVTEGDGLYEDPVEAGRYVYRGANPNNYITFNGEEAGWRIVAIETDGTLKIMKTGSIGNRVFDAANTRTAAYCNDSSNGCNVWGSASTMLDASGSNVTTMPTQVSGSLLALPTEESQMAKYLNTDYYGTLTDEAKGQIDNHLWNVGPLADEAQTLEVGVNQEKAYKWRGKIGLINLSDYVKSTTDMGCITIKNNNFSCGNNNYMKTTSNVFWTMNSLSYSISSSMWVLLLGSLSHAQVVYNYDIYPVVFIKSDITLSGTGTQTDPYTIN